MAYNQVLRQLDQIPVISHSFNELQIAAGIQAIRQLVHLISLSWCYFV